MTTSKVIAETYSKKNPIIKKLLGYILLSSMITIIFAPTVRAESTLYCAYPVPINIYNKPSSRPRLLKRLPPGLDIYFLPGQSQQRGWQQISAFKIIDRRYRGGYRKVRIVVQGRAVPMYVYLRSSDMNRAHCKSVAPASSDFDPPQRR